MRCKYIPFKKIITLFYAYNLQERATYTFVLTRDKQKRHFRSNNIFPQYLQWKYTHTYEYTFTANKLLAQRAFDFPRLMYFDGCSLVSFRARLIADNKHLLACSLRKRMKQEEATSKDFEKKDSVRTSALA